MRKSVTPAIPFDNQSVAVTLACFSFHTHTSVTDELEDYTIILFFSSFCRKS